jgi:hypothetical protein
MIQCHCTGCGACVETRRKADQADWEQSPEDGEWYCPDCRDYEVDPDTGEAICGTHDVPPIEWDYGRTPSGRRYGTAPDGTRWLTEDRGGCWSVPRPLGAGEEES